MTDKLKEKELLDVLDGVFSFYLGELGHEEDKPKIRQTKKQIVALIQKEAERDEIEAHYIDIVIDLYDQLEQKKPEVTEEFVKKWMNIIRPETPVSIRLAIKDMLKEAGVEVVGK